MRTGIHPFPQHLCRRRVTQKKEKTNRGLEQAFTSVQGCFLGELSTLERDRWHWKTNRPVERRVRFKLELRLKVRASTYHRWRSIFVGPSGTWPCATSGEIAIPDRPSSGGRARARRASRAARHLREGGGQIRSYSAPRAGWPVSGIFPPLTCQAAAAESAPKPPLRETATGFG